MTVTYSDVVATSKGAFLTLLFRWRGSLYKRVWKDLLVYIMLYSLISLMYRSLLTESQKRVFEEVSVFCNEHSSLINLSFLLGFYVSMVAGRWWDQYQAIPWPDKLALYLTSCHTDTNNEARLQRRSIMRYAVLSFVLTMRMISPPVKKRFPDMKSLEEYGLLLPHETELLNKQKPDSNVYWTPLVWAANLVSKARTENKIKDSVAMRAVLDQIAEFRGGCGSLLGFDSINIPLVYTQVMTLAVYTFFLFSLLGRQFLDPANGHPGRNIDLYVPVFTLLQFVFFMGWLKVAECLLNPFGDDDDDFEVEKLIERNFQVSYLIVDKMQKVPELKRDIHWDSIIPHFTPYHGLKGSVANIAELNQENTGAFLSVPERKRGLSLSASSFHLLKV